MHMTSPDAVQSRGATFLRRLRGDESGVALIEFAYALPVVLALSFTGAELTNYITVKLRISQLALHVADSGARLGEGTQLQAKTVSEADIEDMFTGARLQAGELGIIPNGRMIVSSVEPVANPNPTARYKIAWQRCKGARVHPSSYGLQGTTNMTGMGPTGRQVRAPDDGAAIFVEINYKYQPIMGFWPNNFDEITEIATMPVRDRRDTSQVYPSPGVTAATC